MNLEQISNWTDIENIDQKVSAEVRSWLLEKGPITQRIKLTEEFKLQIICDEEKEVPDSELKFLKFKNTYHLKYHFGSIKKLDVSFLKHW